MLSTNSSEFLRIQKVWTINNGIVSIYFIHFFSQFLKQNRKLKENKLCVLISIWLEYKNIVLQNKSDIRDTQRKRKRKKIWWRKKLAIQEWVLIIKKNRNISLLPLRKKKQIQRKNRCYFRLRRCLVILIMDVFSDSVEMFSRFLRTILHAVLVCRVRFYLFCYRERSFWQSN